jgi:hypothetical protein
MDHSNHNMDMMTMDNTITNANMDPNNGKNMSMGDMMIVRFL